MVKKKMFKINYNGEIRETIVEYINSEKIVDFSKLQEIYDFIKEE